MTELERTLAGRLPSTDSCVHFVTLLLTGSILSRLLAWLVLPSKHRHSCSLACRRPPLSASCTLSHGANTSWRPNSDTDHRRTRRAMTILWPRPWWRTACERHHHQLRQRPVQEQRHPQKTRHRWLRIPNRKKRCCTRGLKSWTKKARSCSRTSRYGYRVSCSGCGES